MTSRRLGGRPTKLTERFIERFLVHARQGLHLSQCAALEGLSPNMLTAWLKTGKDDDERGTDSIHRRFSVAVRAVLAELQRQGITTLAVYQRMAEGWDPTCTACTTGRRPCGAHPKQLKLAADLQRWMLSHRFPREWSPGTVPAIMAGDQDATGLTVASSSSESAPAPMAFGAIVFLPARPRDDLE